MQTQRSILRFHARFKLIQIYIQREGRAARTPIHSGHFQWQPLPARFTSRGCGFIVQPGDADKRYHSVSLSPG